MYDDRYDEETGIITRYHLYIEGVELDFNRGWHPGATTSLYKRNESRSTVLYTTINCKRALHWADHKPERLWGGDCIEIEYLEDGHLRREVLVTEEEADEIASRAVYNRRNEAHIAVPRTFSVGRSTVWFKVQWYRWYNSTIHLDVSLIVEFGNSEECTRFLHEDMRKLEDRAIYGGDTDGAVIDDIMRALRPIRNDLDAAWRNGARRCLAFDQFIDELPEPETQLIHHKGQDQPCYLTLSISASISHISSVEWSATTIPSTIPSPSGAYRSLRNLHLEFPLDDRNSSHQDDLTISIFAREISSLDGTNSVSVRNSVSINSLHRTVSINYINNAGDALLALISGGNNGGRNNVNTIHMNPYPNHACQRNSLELKVCCWLRLVDILSISNSLGE